MSRAILAARAAQAFMSLSQAACVPPVDMQLLPATLPVLQPAMRSALESALAAAKQQPAAGEDPAQGGPPVASAAAQQAQAPSPFRPT